MRPYKVMLRRLLWNQAFLLDPTTLLNPTQVLSIQREKENSLWSQVQYKAT